MVVVLLVCVSLLALLFYWAGCPGPGFCSGYERQQVLWVSVVALVNFSEENWALPAPAGMPFHIAQDAVLALRLVALASPVFLCTVATCVLCRDAFVCEVIPPIALEASDWLFLDFLNVCPVVADGETVSYGPVGSVSIRKGENEMSSLLAR